MLTAAWISRDYIPDDSLLLRFNLPRFRPGNFEANLRLSERMQEIARKKRCTPAQLVINWTRALSERMHGLSAIPIPGCTTVGRVVENSKLVGLTSEDMAETHDVVSQFVPARTWYP